MENIKEKRLELGLTQLDLALRVGVSTNTIRSWERGASTPREYNLEILQEVLKEEEKK